LERTAITVGAGAGVGVAIGSMTRNQNGALIGALIGSAGGLVLDEILKHREQAHPQAIAPPNPKDPPVLKRRTR
jgi:YmgG-like glycine-zipper protein